MTDVERKVIVQAVHGELGVAMGQMIDSDDKIIRDHVRKAHQMLSELLANSASQETDLGAAVDETRDNRWEGWQL